ncbi:MAG: AbgT family transporter, partial [Lentisphaeria bacterium]
MMKSFIGKFVTNALNKAEKIGNKLPHPVTIFFILTIGLIVISHLVDYSLFHKEFSKADPVTGAMVTEKVYALSLLSASGIRFILEKMVTNFTSFAPLGTVLVTMLGIGVAEGSGLISAILKRFALITPKPLVTASVVFLGVMSNTASDAGYVVLVPLGAIIFLTFGRHPLAGLAAAFAGVSGGFSANLILGSLDPMLAGITQEAARIINPNILVSPADNLYFMFISTFLITIIGTIVTDFIVEPRLGPYNGNTSIDHSISTISKNENKALIFAFVTFLITIIIIAFLALPEYAPLRDPHSGDLIGNTPFINSIVALLMLLFALPGIAYAIVVGTIKNDRDLEKMLTKSMSSMGSYLVLAF